MNSDRYTPFSPVPMHLRLDVSSLTYGEDRVQSPSNEWAVMATRWALPHDLLGGTLTMRAAGEQWLPREPREEWKNYLIRISRAVLYNGYKNAVKRIVQKPFSRPVTLKGDLPPQLEKMKDNIDLQGTSLTEFAKALMHDAAVHGKTHFLVEYPKTGGGQTLRDETEGGIRPYFVHVPAPTVIGWRRGVDEVTGEEYPTQVRVRDTRMEQNGEYGQELADRVRVLEPGKYTTYSKTASQTDFVQVEEVEIVQAGKVMQRIPLVTIYFEKTGFFTAAPPFEDLAWLNCAHWQSSADHRNYLRFSRIGLLFAKGFSDEEIEKGVVISPNTVKAVSNTNATLEFVEHKGSAIAAGVDDINKLEEQMEVMGMQPLIERSASSTATGKVFDEGNNDAASQVWVRAVESGLLEGFKHAHAFIGVEMDEDFGVDIFSDFAIAIRSSDDIDKLQKMRDSRDLSHETFINETKRRGILSDDVDAETERERIDEEDMDAIPEVPLGLPNAGDNPPAPNGPPDEDPELGAPPAVPPRAPPQ